MKLQCSRMSSPDVWLDAVSELYGQFFTSGLGFCSDMHFQLLDVLLRCVCLSKSSHSIELGHRLPSLEVELKSRSNMNAPELNLNCIRV